MIVKSSGGSAGRERGSKEERVEIVRGVERGVEDESEEEMEERVEVEVDESIECRLGMVGREKEGPSWAVRSGEEALDGAGEVVVEVGRGREMI